MSGNVTLQFDDIKAVPKSSGAINLVVHITAKPGKESTVKEHLSKIREAANSDAEKGTLIYKVLESATEPKTFLVFEEYADAAAFEHHTNGEVFKALFAHKDALIDILHPRWYTSL